MCGIVGVIADREDRVRQALPAMMAAVAHRGPDDAGEFYAPFGRGFLGLGHRRLSIIDLSSAGHEPMAHPGSGSCLVFNGEIYNFLSLRKCLVREGDRFAGHCDAEVLLYALERWGPGCLNRLQGMYAFGWFDARLTRLVLARDPLGIKPLYVYHAPGLVLFASEVRALLASGLVGRRIDRRGLAGLLAFGAVQEPFTIVEGVRMLPAGHTQEVGLDLRPSGPTPFFEFPTPRDSANGKDLSASLLGTLDEAVREHLVSDVPVGLFLSGGLDSGAVAALAARHHAGLRSFTVGFADRPDLSELGVAAATARRLGLQHTEILVGDEDARSHVHHWLADLDQPSVDGLNVYIISRAVRAQGITVALSGQGGDELFGGYPSFADVPRLFRYYRYARWMPARVRGALLAGLVAGRDVVAREKVQDVASGSGSLLSLYLVRRRLMSDGLMGRLGLRAGAVGLTPDWQPVEAVAGVPEGGPDPVWLVSLYETRFYQGNMLLRDTDVNSMAHALEVRVPMLDRRVVELAFRLPGRVRLPHGRSDKHLLREAIRPLLPPEPLRQPKHGFTLPIGQWLLGSLRPFTESALSALGASGAVRLEGVRVVWDRFQKNPEGPLWSRAFTLAVLGDYLARHRLT
jgi:asparagine synthase (glutamine-hydrolysing)